MMRKMRIIVTSVVMLSLCGITWSLEPNLIGLEIIGPNEVPEESAAQYTAIVVYDNNSTKDVTNEAAWAVMSDNYADIDNSGLLNTDQLVMPTEDVTIYAEYEEANDIVQAEKNVQIFAICPDGSALEFDGTNDHIIVPDNQSQQIQTNQITLSAWILLKSDLVEGQGRIICKQERSGQSSWNLGIYRHDYGNSIGNRLFFHDSDGFTWYNCFSQTDLQLNRWYHVAATDAAGVIKIYIDGQLNTACDQGYGILPSIDSNIYIGSSIYFGTPLFFFSGLIDEVAMFDRALSAEEIADLMHFGVTIDTNLIGYWNFDEGDGQVAYDSGGYANDGYLGSDPCNPDDSDPCWVEPGAPMLCTPRQMILRNLNGALEDKAIAAELIDSALQKERASARLLMDGMKEQDNCCWKRWIMWPVVEIKKSMLFEEQCKHKLQASIEALERTLQWLLNEAVPGWPQKPENPGKGPNK